MSTIAESLAAVQRRVREAALACGRDPHSVKLVAVSKTQPTDAIREAYAAGQRAFGENYAQELEQKAEALADLDKIEWHFIGHFQSNKAKVLARVAHVVHTLSTAPCARELARRVAREGRAPMPVLLEVNVSGEPQKSGVSPSEIAELMAAVKALPELALSGLMTVPPAGSVELAQSIFETLGSLRSLHGGAAALPELSMGMSADLEPAVAAGATFVRIGTAIFGERKRRGAAPEGGESPPQA